MRCPYSDCRKDYNDEVWIKVVDKWINPSDFSHSLTERTNDNRIYLISRRCRFCHRLFHDVLVGHENFNTSSLSIESTLDPLVSYPIFKTKFESKRIPKKVLDAFNEAERCRSVGSLTGTGSCLRKSVYALCDAKGVSGSDYREKISNLPVKDIYKELLKQIKWIGDNTTKSGDEKYSIEMIDMALEILPILVDDIYLKDERAGEVARLLAKAKSIKTSTEEAGY